MASHPEPPAARTRDLIVKTIGDEILVYDLERHRAHSLNRVAAAVWRRCDGTRPAPRIAADLRRVDGLPVTDDAMHYALTELGRAHLLLAPAVDPGLTRRELVKRLGAAAAVALPLVTSIVTPTAAQAQSATCAELGQTCTSPPIGGTPDCCGGPELLFCLGGVCVQVP